MLTSGDQYDFLDCSGGGDRQEGAGGQDTLLGGAGSDLVMAGEGDDRVVWSPGEGEDSLHGGNCTDTLVIATKDLTGRM
jgi:Ca2+-binding RTX toxin-like protein